MVVPTATSFGAPESEVYDFDYPDYYDQYTVNSIAAGLGISMNYSSGDSGDFYPYGDYYPYTDVSSPAGSPDATSVGSTAQWLPRVKFTLIWVSTSTVWSFNRYGL